MSDPFQDAARRATRDAEKQAKDDANPNRPDRVQQRIVDRAKAKANAQNFDPPYPWPDKFYHFKR